MWRAVLLVAATVRLASAQGWSPVDSNGWPKGETPASLRHLPPCHGYVAAMPGEEITCRPRILSDGPRLAFSLDWTSGPAFGTERTIGGMHAMGFDVHHAVTRWLRLGARYEVTGIGTPAAMTAPDDGFSHHLFASARARYFVDEIERSAWTLGVGAGWAFRKPALGGDAPIARLSLAREVGMYLDDDNAVTMALEVAYEQSLGEVPLQALLASARFGFETNIREPKGFGTEPSARSPSYTVGAGVLLGRPLGFDFDVGLGRGTLGLQTSLGQLFGVSDFNKQHGFDGAQWSVMTGPRLAHLVYAQAQAGVAWVAQQGGGELDVIGQGELGLSGMIAGCVGVDAGIWARRNFSDAAMAGAGMLMRVWVTGRRDGRCGHRRDTPVFATEPPPPPPPVPEPEPEPELPRVAEPAPPPPPRVGVVVEVEPVVVDVTLGVEWLGVRVQLDPRLLPIAQLRGAGFVRVELFGPAGALAGFQARLQATLGRAGARVDAWSTVATGASALRARFTIWPPGTRPAP